MKKNFRQQINDFSHHWKNYVGQSLCATFAIFLILLFLNSLNTVIIASIGASVFIVFAMPKSITAKPRNIIGGHITGLVSGSLFALIPHTLFLGNIILCSLAVGVSIFIMVVIDMEHPPAAGTALGVAITGFSLDASLAIIISTLILSLIHIVLKKQIHDLV